MTLTAYALSAIIAFSGVIAGVILAFRTPEEIAGAEKYLPKASAGSVCSHSVLFHLFFKAGIPGCGYNFCGSRFCRNCKAWF